MALIRRIRALSAVASASLLITAGCDLLPVEDRAPDPGYLEGTVVDAVTGLGIEDATVSTGSQSDVTSSLGGYSIDNVPSGTPPY